MASVGEAQADFAVNLLRETALANPNASLILSPISIAVALSMVYVGAKGDSKAQLAKVLANGASEDEIHNHFGGIVRELSAAHENYTLESANRVYLQAGLKVEGTFRESIQRYYQGEFKEIDFHNKLAAAKAINGYVAEKTHGKIKELVNAVAIDPSAVLYLINAVYFKGAWQTPFDPKHTQKQAFYVAEGNEQQVDTMFTESEFPYFSDEHAEVVGLPYSGKDIHMIVLLPKERFGLQKLLSSLNGKMLLEYVEKVHQTKPRDIEVHLPRFKIETSEKLKKTLIKLGLENIFGDADLSGIATKPLAVNEVFHKVFIEVNEEGSEAAGATGVEIQTRSRKPEFKADHPFAYAIVNEAGQVLFLGQVSSFL